MECCSARKGEFTMVGHRKGSSHGARHTADTWYGGKPSDAVGWIGEGEWGSFLTMQFTAPLDPELAAKGIGEDDWEEICKLLRKGKGRFLFDATNPATGTYDVYGFSKAIKMVNEQYLEKAGCIGVYSEYRNGMKAMAVFTKEAWDAKPE